VSFFEVLKNGEIPTKTSKKRSKTPYDDYMEGKKLVLPVEDKNITVAKPAGFADIQKLIDKLKTKQGVIVDLSAVGLPLAQRMLDFLSGAVYALGGNIDKVDNKMYVLAGSGVEIVNKIDN